jgi:hypothetical protein
LANYDTNRLPVINGNNAPTPTQCPGCFPLPAFDNARLTWLTAAQAIPDQVFGTPVRSYLARFGITQFVNLTYQVNSADQIQAVTVLFRPPAHFWAMAI